MNKQYIFSGSLVVAFAILSGCSAGNSKHPISSIPALTFADSTRTSPPPMYTQSYREYVTANQGTIQNPNVHFPTDARGRYLAVKNYPSDSVTGFGPGDNSDYNGDYVTNEGNMANNNGNGNGDTVIYRNPNPMQRGYRGPLQLGNPGLSASLWQESKHGNHLFRDERALQPYDLVTIIVDERSEAQKEADTEVKEESTVQAALANLLGYENDILESNTGIDLNNLVNASTTNDFKGEADTSRRGRLRTSISGVVLEVLPGGLMRIEGEKIISVNSEEQVIVISGLVRQRDINSQNEIPSTKIAQLRIDYYGTGTVGEAQNGGWLGRTMRYVWPF